MGSFFRPKTPSPSPPPPAPPAPEEDDAAIAADAARDRARRAQFGTLATSFRGLVGRPIGGARKSLLGE